MEGITQTASTTIGVILLGSFCTAILYGITCFQCLMFFQRFPREGALLKYSMALLWTLDTTHLVMVIHGMYFLLVKSFGQARSFDSIPWSIGVAVIITSVSDVIVQCWFTYRVWVLSGRNYILGLALGVLILAVCGLIIAYAVLTLPLITVTDIGEYRWLLILDLALLVATDTTIAALLCFFLYRSRAKTTKRTYSLLNKLMAYAVSTGLLTSLFVLACLITYIAMPINYVFIAIYLPIGKLYINAFLTSLNTRDIFKKPQQGNLSIDLSDCRTGRRSVALPTFAPMTFREYSSNDCSINEDTETEKVDHNGSADQDSEQSECGSFSRTAAAL